MSVWASSKLNHVDRGAIFDLDTKQTFGDLWSCCTLPSQRETTPPFRLDSYYDSLPIVQGLRFMASPVRTCRIPQ